MFSDEIFSDEINECDSSPCKHGVCVDGENNYTCICEQGYRGENCEGLFDMLVLLQSKHADK